MKIKKIFIIAEAGVNHNGNVSRALKMVNIAKNAGVDAIKFQSYVASKLSITKAPLAKYQKGKNFKNQFKLLKKYELSEKSQKKIKKYCKKKKIIFLSSGFDIQSLKFLKSLNLKFFKVPSGEITNFPYLKELGSYNKKILLSTGASEIKDIKFAIKTLILSGTSKKKITLLHCNSDYPTPFRDANLKAINFLKSKFNLNVGFSDHTLNIEASIAAAAMGATVIEKHFTLNQKLNGPDHLASVNKSQLFQMVKSIRNIEIALGQKNKFVTKSEKKNRNIIRKSIVAKKAIKRKDKFSRDNIDCKRPGNGISPIFWNKVLGKKAKKNFKKDELIRL